MTLVLVDVSAIYRARVDILIAAKPLQVVVGWRAEERHLAAPWMDAASGLDAVRLQIERSAAAI